MSKGTQNAPCRLQFGSFELDLQMRDLRKHGLKIKLPPQAFIALDCLLENPGELTARDLLFRRLWPDHTYVEFETNLNAIIRVLREALGDSARNPRFIETEPKLGYRFIAPVSVISYAQPAEPVAVLPPRPERRRNRTPLVAGTVLLAVILLAWLGWRIFGRSAVSGPTYAHLKQITHFLGIAGHPAISPDGLEVAFHWNGDARGNFDIYTMKIGAEEVRRLTNAGGQDAIWSPDGRDIAFLRHTVDGHSDLMLIPPMGGAERKLATLPRVKSLCWSPDGRWIAWSLAAPDSEANPAAHEGIRAISLLNGRQVQLTAGDGEAGDALPAFSRSGRELAFVRHGSLWRLPLGDELRPAGPAAPFTPGARGVVDPVWMPDGNSILFAADRSGGFGKLWTLAVGRAKAAPVELGGEDAFEPSVDARGRRVVFSRSAVVDSLNALKLCGANCTPEPPTKVVYSTKLARNPSFSPDGRRIAFESAQSGHMEVWSCGSDGSAPAQVTHMGGPPAGTPNWSPDGTRIAFDARLRGGSAIFVIPAAGGTPLQLTSGDREDLVPSWSRDGKSIYFSSKRTGVLQVWRMSAGGGGQEQLTKGGGFRAVESWDGKFVYYSRGAAQTSIWRVPSGGGVEAPAIESLGYWQNFSVTRDGIYYIPASTSRTIPIHLFDMLSGVSRRVGAVEGLGSQGITASPDDRTLVFSRRESNDRDLMLMELK